MRIGMAMALGARRRQLAASIKSLFAAEEQGVWYDPSDLSTLFQDAAGTTPVTAVEQPVGLMLDKSKGLVLGPELVVNGTFDTDISGWTVTAGAVSWDAGTIKCGTGASGRATKAIPATVNATYLISVTVTAGGNGIVRFGADSTGATGSVLSISTLTPGTYTYRLAATAGVMYLSVGSTSSANLDNISVRELPGNHATQTTSTSRPVLSARYNLLTKTEQFDDVAWSKSNVTVTANAVVAPDGTMTGDKVVEDTATSRHAVVTAANVLIPSIANTVSVYAAPAERSRLRVIFSGSGNSDWCWIDLSTGVVTVGSAAANGLTASATFEANGFYKLTITLIPVVTGTINFDLLDGVPPSRFSNYTGDGTSGIYIWGASLVPANQADLPYQRVNTATDYDADPAKFPPYLKFDGVDDFLVTNSIDFTSTDKMTVFAGVRKLSDAATAFVVELSADLNVNPGVFAIAAPGSVSPLQAYRFVSKGTIPRGVGDATVPTAPTTNGVTGIGDISGDNSILRVNGAQVAQSTLDQGTGNYGNYPLYIGRRGGTTLPFNGHIYSLIVRGAATTDTRIAQTERWVAKKTGVTL